MKVQGTISNLVKLIVNVSLESCVRLRSNHVALICYKKSNKLIKSMSFENAHANGSKYLISDDKIVH